MPTLGFKSALPTERGCTCVISNDNNIRGVCVGWWWGSGWKSVGEGFEFRVFGVEVEFNCFWNLNF